MRSIFMVLGLVFSGQVFALSNQQVKDIVQEAAWAKRETRGIEVVRVRNSLNPAIGLGQVLDGLVFSDRDFEFKRVTFRWSSFLGDRYGTITMESTCMVLVSVSAQKLATVDVRECKSKDQEEGGRFPEEITVSGIAVSL